MNGIENWVVFRSDKQRKEELAEYKKLIFPYGDEQKDRVFELLKELIPKKYNELALYNYMVARQALVDIQEPELIIAQGAAFLKKHLPKKERCFIGEYLAMILCDQQTGADLAYPDIETLKAKAQELNSRL